MASSITWIETADSTLSIEELLATTAAESPQGNIAVLSGSETTQSDRTLVSAATQLAEPSFANVWNNPEDNIYNNL